MTRFAFALPPLLLLWFVCTAQPSRSAIESSSLDREITDFLDKEMLAHLDDIKSYNPPPDKVFGAGTTGEYTWGSFMNAVGAYAAMSGRRTLGKHDLAREVGQAGLLEYRLKGTRFSQLYGVLALRFFGRDLNTNPVWQSLNEEERAQWRNWLDVSAFYDSKTQQVINLPENYLGVAARIASVSYQLGLLKDRALVDGVILRGAGGAAGHLGHVTLDPRGGLCICGNYGCLETHFSSRAIESDYWAHMHRAAPAKLSISSTGEVPNPEAIFRAAADGDECARYVVDRALEYLGAALVSFLHTFDPEIFILGGNIVAAGPQLIAPIQDKIARRTRTLLGREVPIVFQTLVGYGGVAGAAGLVFLKQNLLAI